MHQHVAELDINLLLTLDALLREENVTRAAARLSITQSALSGRLTKLRHVLNDPLFIPASSGRGMTPTPHALALRPDLDRLLEQLTRFVQSAHVFDPASSDRTFTIAAGDNPAAILAPDLLPLIQQRAPALRVAFVLPNQATIAERLEKGEIDLFIGALTDATPDMIGRMLFSEQLVTAQRKGHPRGTAPLTLDEFCHYDHLVISTDGGGFSGIIDTALADLERQRHVSVSIQSYALTPLVLGTTDCLCTLPRGFLERFTDTLDLFMPPFDLATFDLRLFWHPRMNMDPGHTWFRNQILQAAGQKSHQRQP